MRWLFLFVGFQLVAATASSQEHSVRNDLEGDYDRFREIMEKETRVKDSASLHQYFLIPQQLPDWFFYPSRYSPSPDYFIGVSEPGMDSLAAMRLAILRGKALALLSRKASIDNISDHFKVVRESIGFFERGSHYLDFSKIYGKYSMSAESFSVQRTLYTKYGEGIALVAFQPDQQRDTLSVQGEIMQLTHEDDRSLEKTLLCRLDIKQISSPEDARVKVLHRPDAMNVIPPKLVSRYKYEGLDNNYQVRSFFAGDTLYVPDHPYRYSSTGKARRPAESPEISAPLSTGLWNGFIHLLFSHLNYYNRHLESRVKSSYDQYNLKQQQILRTVSRNAVRFRLDSISISGHSLMMGLEVRPHDADSP